MNSYFISPPEANSWEVSPNLLAEELKSQWANIQVETVDAVQSIHALSWILKIGEWRLDGTLTKEGDVVHLDGDVRACAAFAIWFRTVIPIEQDLLFYDEGYSSDIALNEGMTEVDLIEPFMAT